MDMTSRMTSHFDDAVDAFRASARELAPALAAAVDLMFGALTNNARILACGNGGSAATASADISAAPQA